MLSNTYSCVLSENSEKRPVSNSVAFRTLLKRHLSVLRYFKNKYHKKNKHWFSVCNVTGIPPSTIKRYKKSLVYLSSGRVQTKECKDHRLYRATPPTRDTGKGYKYRFLFLLFPTTFSFLFQFYNHFLTMCK